ncbi:MULTISPECIES: hypothetical protein [unclassified Methanoregula]|uniref:hypothetical protein n=1 Tax=unclassified Methanoregula TaxID=2649730 RepID=UPI0009C8517A|nr:MULTISPECIES: hypothetical protein [unclassified Methanoregula]OPX63247.1 MAG: hypothetical protein A4E33_01754 [Methanoregula sp. PtaB.Bin085]OPY35007.1 MAG: hypothetical protein A4E34_01117 [Methanoregula sp. PtaU1.Bin006]
MAQVFVDDGPKKMSDGENANAIVNLFIVEAIIVVVCSVAYFYLTLVLGWDPRITIIPVIVVLISVSLFLRWKLKKITAESEKYSKYTSAPPFL